MEKRTYSNVKILGAAGLSLATAVALLVLFIVFVCIKKPAYSDLNKFIFMTLCINFFLFIIYGVVAFLKDPFIRDYAFKTWMCCLIVSTTIVILSIFSLMKSTERRLPTASLWTSIAVAALIFLINTEFCIDDLMSEINLLSKPISRTDAYPDKDTEITQSRMGNELKEDNKESEEPLFKKPPPEESSIRSDKSEAEGSLRKEKSAPVNAIPRSFKKRTSGNKIEFEKTHFIVAIEAGANTKHKWGEIINGLQEWLKSLSDDSILVSLFTFDSSYYITEVCKTPSEMLALVTQGIEARGAAFVNIDAVLDGFCEILKSAERGKKNAYEYLNYGFMFIGDDGKYSELAVNKFLDVKKNNGPSFFMNITSQVKRTYVLTELIGSIGGVHYSIRKDKDLGLAIAESLQRDPNAK